MSLKQIQFKGTKCPAATRSNMAEQEPFKILSAKEYSRLSTAEKRKYYSELANAFHLHHIDNELRRIWVDLKNARQKQ